MTVTIKKMVAISSNDTRCDMGRHQLFREDPPLYMEAKHTSNASRGWHRLDSFNSHMLTADPKFHKLGLSTLAMIPASIKFVSECKERRVSEKKIWIKLV